MAEATEWAGDRWEYESFPIGRDLPEQMAEMNRLGGEGWEFCSTMESIIGPVLALMKRPLPPPDPVGDPGLHGFTREQAEILAGTPPGAK